MTEKDFEYISNTLRELSMFIHDCAEKTTSRQKALNNKRLFNFDRIPPDEHERKQLARLEAEPSPVGRPTEPTAPSRSNVAKQLNRLVWSNKEIKEMPYLKDLKYRITQNGIHQFRYRRDGFNVSFNSKNYEEAKRKAREFILDLKKEMVGKSKELRGRTVDDVAQAWFDLKRERMHIRTWKGYESVYRLHIKPVLGSKTLKSLLPLHLQPFFDELFKKHGKTCENAKVILNGVFEFAIANRFMNVNPLKGVEVDKHIRTPGKALTQDQILRFVKLMAQDETRYGIAGLIMLYTGIRGYELQSLKFDWTAGTYTVANAKLKRTQRRNPKNLYRTVPIPPLLFDLQEKIERSDFNVQHNTLQNYFKKHWAENTIKDLRHTFISRARELGVENELVNLWTGHLPGANVTANIYTHFSLNFQKKEAEKLKRFTDFSDLD